MNNSIFNWFKIVWAYIDNGLFFRRPFSCLYMLMAVLNLFFPLFFIYSLAASSMFDYMSGGQIFIFILIFLLLVFLAIMSFSLWMNRRKKLEEIIVDNKDFVATPMISHFIQTGCEWLGFYIGIAGSVVSLLLVLCGMNAMFGSVLGSTLLPMGTGLFMVIMYPLLGYLIVVSGRVAAEMFRALVAVAINVRQLAMTVSKGDSANEADYEDSPEDLD